MALVYFDASALVKLLVEEDGTELAAELWDGCDAALSSRLAYVEVRAALAAAVRRRDLTSADAAAAVGLWHDFWDAVRPVEFTRRVEQRAAELAARHALRGADAVHLASSLVLDTEELILAAWDGRLRAGAVAEGVAVAPAALRSH